VSTPRRRTIGHENRTSKTLIYLTPTERAALEELAGRWGCTVSTLIRALCEIGVSCIEHHGPSPDEAEPEDDRPAVTPAELCAGQAEHERRWRTLDELPDTSVLYPFGWGHDHG